MSEQPPQQEQSGETPTHINLKVVNADGVEIYFKIKRSTPLRKLMDAYCKKQGLVPGSVRFTFDGSRLNPDSNPNELEMDDQDVIDAMVEQTGGQFFHGYYQRSFW